MRSNSAARSNASEMWRYSATLGSTAESSSYPLSTTACRRARVTKSPLANNVTSQPRATSPSVMLLATVSQAPYCPGGVRQATGDRTATLLLGFAMLLNDPNSWQPALHGVGPWRNPWRDRPDHRV